MQPTVTVYTWVWVRWAAVPLALVSGMLSGMRRLRDELQRWQIDAFQSAFYAQLL